METDSAGAETKEEKIEVIVEEPEETKEEEKAETTGKNSIFSFFLK